MECSKIIQFVRSQTGFLDFVYSVAYLWFTLHFQKDFYVHMGKMLIFAYTVIHKVPGKYKIDLYLSYTRELYLHNYELNNDSRRASKGSST